MVSLPGVKYAIITLFVPHKVKEIAWKMGIDIEFMKFFELQSMI
jgi:hypothetical protein